MLAKVVRPFHFKIFFSNKYVHATVLDKIANTAVASVCSNNKLFTERLGQYACKNDEDACELAGQMLAEKARVKQASRLLYLRLIVSRLW